MDVLVAMDDSDPGRAALKHALETYPDAAITVMHVLEVGVPLAYGGEMTYNYDVLREAQEEDAEALLADAQAMADDHGKTITTKTVEGSPSRTIIQVAEDSDVDHIVVGSHGRTGVSRILLGSVAERIVRRAPVSVTVVRNSSA